MPLVANSPSDTATKATLDSPDPAARRLAVADCADAALLLAQLRVEADMTVRHAILSRLGGLGGPGVAQALGALLAADDARLRGDAILALRRLGEAALPAIDAALAAADADLRIFACNVLEGLPGAESRLRLRQVLAAEAEVNVCMAAVEALAQQGAPEDAAALRALPARLSAEPFIAFAVGLALDEIGA